MAKPKPRPGQVTKLIVAYMEKVGAPLTSREISDGTGVSIKSVYNVLYRGVNEMGLFRKVDDSRYVLINAKPPRWEPGPQIVGQAPAPAPAPPNGSRPEPGDLFEMVGLANAGTVVRSLDSNRLYTLAEL